MDNILKLLLGVLGLAGLLAMLTPSTMPVAPIPGEPAVEVAAPADVVAEVIPEEAEPEEADDEIVKFGEPMIDGNPIADDEAPQQNVGNPVQPSPAANGNGYVDYTQTLNNAALPGYGGVQPIPPAITNAPPVEERAPAM